MILIKKLKKYFYALLMGSIIGLLVYNYQPSYWQTKAVISLAMYDYNSQPLEPVLITLERAKSQNFYQNILDKLNGQAKHDYTLASIKRTTLRQIANTNTIVITRKDFSKNSSTNIVRLFSEQLLEQNMVFAKTIASQHKDVWWQNEIVFSTEIIPTYSEEVKIFDSIFTSILFFCLLLLSLVALIPNCREADV